MMGEKRMSLPKEDSSPLATRAYSRSLLAFRWSILMVWTLSWPCLCGLSRPFKGDKISAPPLPSTSLRTMTKSLFLLAPFFGPLIGLKEIFKTPATFRTFSLRLKATKFKNSPVENYGTSVRKRQLYSQNSSATHILYFFCNHRKFWRSWHLQPHPKGGIQS